MKKLPFLPALLAALAILLLPPAARAQLSNAAVVSSCGSASFPTGSIRSITQDGSGKACVNASVSATANIASFSPGATATQSLATTTTSARSAALTGATQLIQNTGTSDAYLVFGNSTVTATTAGGTLLRAGYAISYDVSASGATNVAAITASGSTTLVISGGAGLPAMAGASSSGGGSVPTGSAGSPNAAVVTVQGISGGTTLPVTLSGTNSVNIGNTPTVNLGTLNGVALDTSVNGLLLAQGSTTTGQKGPLVQCAVTTAAPTYTTANTLPLSCDTSGNLRVTGGGGGGGAVTVASGADVTEGGTSDTTCTGGSHTLSGCLYVAANAPGTLTAASTGGATPGNTAALSTTVTSLKASAGSLYMLYCYNPNSSAAYVQVFNVASGSVTLGTTAPTLSFGIAATASGGYAMSSIPIAFSTAISYAATTTATGSTANSSAVSCAVAYQ